ncbi:MAG TPA: M48 family metalloprotease [Solirubrobacteraceae bacterium]|nr:M48 family metalloprotease [Solirubrobacteraceae bacterium]
MTAAARRLSPESPARAAALAAALLATAAAWVLAAHALLHTTVPSLRLPHVDPRSYFTAHYLQRADSYERFLDVDSLLGSLTLVVVLIIYARRGARLMAQSAAGRVGTGMLLGMLGFGIVWLAELPFGLAADWWQRRHGVSHQGYLTSVLESFTQLGGRFLFVSLALLVAMGFAGLTRRWWWALAAPLFVGLALLSVYLSVYLVPNTHPLRDSQRATEVQTLAREEGVAGTRADVQDVSRFTTAPNAESVGFGATRRVILWDTLLDGRFSRPQVRVVIAHELGHLAHHHLLKQVGWLALFLIPASALVAFFTRSLGGLANPEAVPRALLVFVVLQLLTLPLMNIVSRRDESEADWSALRATHDPQAARGLFERLAVTSLADPDPPTWSYVLYANHPTIVQRLAMTRAYAGGAR